jgi:hypothetical protein
MPYHNNAPLKPGFIFIEIPESATGELPSSYLAYRNWNPGSFAKLSAAHPNGVEMVAITEYENA